jgi:DNA-directed RNA polymerase sigma subunit (sigma70/sigma32)
MENMVGSKDKITATESGSTDFSSDSFLLNIENGTSNGSRIKERVLNEIEDLAPGLSIILKERFGFGQQQPKSSEQIAAENNFSTPDIEKIYDRALRALMYGNTRIHPVT